MSNTLEWTASKDQFLQQAIVRNSFNFDLAAIDLSNEIKKQGHLNAVNA